MAFPEAVLEAAQDAEKAQDSLPDDFWNMPSTFIEDPQIRRMYEELYRRLLKENPDRDTMELMRIERASSLYAYMRSLEATEGYSNSTDYRQLSQLWNNMVTDLKKTRSSNVDVAKIREEVMLEFIDVINSSLRGFEPTIASTVKRRLLTHLEETAK